MTAPILAAFAICFVLTSVHIASIAIAICRFRKARHRPPQSGFAPSVSVVRPLCGLDNYAEDTLGSTFALDYPDYEILFCVATTDDPVLSLVRSLMAEHPAVPATLLIGDERISANPKLNNVLKGWRAAAHPWIILADSNVLMPPDYIQRLFASWGADTGLVASPPIGCRPCGLWAELECAFLNTYQARWQYMADTLGYGFAQGKTMLWRRSDLDRAGGIEALASEVAEDAAATKIVRRAGLKVRLVDPPVAQPLGRRRAAEIWHRQLRWARLRRASFPAYFLPEILSGGVLPMIAVGFLTWAHGIPLAMSIGLFAVFWYGAEAILALSAGWHVSRLYPLYGILRDLLLPALFVGALRANGFVWRGNEMQVERVQLLGLTAAMTPRMKEVMAGGRQRLRAMGARYRDGFLT